MDCQTSQENIQDIYLDFSIIITIFMNMGQQQIHTNLKRRMMLEDGWNYFCRICGEYKPENQFYKSKTGLFKIDTRCKIHYERKDKEETNEMDYLKLDRLSDSDFEGAQRLLETLGYKFGIGHPPIHIQFNSKHNIK